ncbi:MAG: glycosyl hydrolase family 9 [Lachnospiraceae bacterium]|nr:glycosyl hydrolase family 9 [Lachnospiraceae bacterium]
MRKKVVSIMLCMMLAVSVAACGAKDTSTETAQVTEQTEETEEETSEEEVQEQPAEEAEPEKEKAEEEEIKPLPEGNMILNPDFSNGKGQWSSYLNGGKATLDVNEEGQLVIDIQEKGKLDHSVQAYYDGITLDDGVVYKFAFDMAVTVPRTVVWRIQINGGDYSAYFLEEIAATTEMQRYEYELKAEGFSDPAPRLCFNVGEYEGDGELGAHQILLDNFEFSVLDGSGRVLPQAAIETPDINVSQVGYLPEQSKKAVFRGDSIGTEFEVIDVASGESVFTGTITGEGKNTSSQENCAVGDFSALKTEGTYKVVNDNCGESYEFKIGTDVYDALLDDTLRMMYLQRCGLEITEELAGDFAHAECHTGSAIVYGTDTAKDVSGGWHDAGDYGKYVVSGAKTVADLLMAYEKYPNAFDDELNIPESGNGIPDILDEVKYELDWMFKMQESNGGVYHKVTCKNFPGTVMPEEETEQLYLSPISNTATGDFAAVMAMAARVYKDIDASYADKCLAAAEKALEYLEANLDAEGFKNPDDVVTGEYPDDKSSDEYFWALAELYKTTGEVSYNDKIKGINTLGLSNGLGWAGVGFYGMNTYLSCDNADAKLVDEIEGIFDFTVKTMNENKDLDAYDSTLGDVYPWGSNMSIANNGMVYLMTEHLAEAESQLAYLLGTNANSYCFVTGYGTLSPQSTHHRPSQVLKQSMVGMLVGGPDSNLEDPYAQATLKGEPKAKCYADNEQSFSCNEVTIYWNSPLVYLIAGVMER